MRVRVLLAISLLFATLFTAALLLNAVVRSHDSEQERQRALNFAQTFAAAYERVLGDQISLLSAVIAMPEASIRHPVLCRTALAAVVGRHGSLLNLATVDAQGHVLCAANTSTADIRIGDHPAFKRSRATLKPALGTLVHVGEANRRAVLLTLPILDADGTLDAVLVSFLDQHWLNERFAETVPSGVVLRILDEEGVFVVRQPDPECCLGRSGLHLGGIKEALASGQPHAGESLWLDDVSRLQADVPLKAPLSGVVSIGIPTSLMQASSNRTLFYVTTGLLMLCLALYVLAWAGTQRYILGPMKVLADTVHRVRGGDLESRVPPLPGHEEFATLGADINAMTTTLAERQKQIEDDLRRLREQEAQRRLAASVFEQAREAIIITDAGANILSVNRRFGEITGYSEEEVIGRNPRILKSDRQDPAFYAGMWHALAATGHWSGEIWNRRKDGTIYPEWLSISAVRDEAGSITNYVSVFTDFTVRKQAERALRQLNEDLERRVKERTQALQTANRELEAFSYSVSHDLRAPLRVISGFSHLLEKEYAPSLDEKARNYIDRVRVGAERMGLLIDDLLTLSQMSRQPMNVAPTNLSLIAEEICADLQAGEPGRPVDWVIEPDVDAVGDAGLLRSVLLNLLGNAWKYTSKRERPRIEFGVAEQDGRRVFFVRDNGAGFDMAHAARLFGAFQRLHSQSEFPGTGIGLATVARIIHRHGGEVWAEGAPDQGAAFHFTLSPG